MSIVDANEWCQSRVVLCCWPMYSSSGDWSAIEPFSLLVEVIGECILSIYNDLWYNGHAALYFTLTLNLPRGMVMITRGCREDVHMMGLIVSNDCNGGENWPNKLKWAKIRYAILTKTFHFAIDNHGRIKSQGTEKFTKFNDIILNTNAYRMKKAWNLFHEMGLGKTLIAKPWMTSFDNKHSEKLGIHAHVGKTSQTATATRCAIRVCPNHSGTYY